MGELGGLERHLSAGSAAGECNFEKIACEFGHVGCTAKLSRAKVADHKRERVEEHLTMAVQTIATLQQQMKQLAAHLKPESLAESPSLIFIPPPAFIMTNFSQHKCAGDTWFSPPFYSHIGGYKMCLEADANGWGDGKGTHVSVYVRLMRGEYDDDLLWPFRGSIVFQLCNCRADTEHLNCTFNVDDRADSNVTGQLTKGERAPSAWGMPKFVPQTALCYNASKNTEFLVNDSLKFRVTAVKLTNLVM